ncbi:LexA family transcriptional regulator [Novosphingobium profundi]|uniref:LexA family transcriptional regulator n=1 Tax=Novosphingobium profundi TaxID=1774954 RepID=UPI001BDABD35|nr:LexA family transcriptional regulator [Novosphingobium profundi]MBT0669689.1 LexA family transcriptional regulator [Novosphingobium profundi]
MASDPVRTRLLELAEARGASLSALSRMLGKNPSYLQQFIRKGSPRKLEEVDRAALARFFRVSEQELGRPEEFSLPGSGKGDSDWVAVPRLSLGASAGPGAVDSQEVAFDSLRFSARWLRAMGLRADRLAVIEVRGDSMEPTLRDGDEILVDRETRRLQDGICVVRLDDVVLVKRVEMGRSGRVYLRSDNPAYRLIECAITDLSVIGRVVWKGGRI